MPKSPVTILVILFFQWSGVKAQTVDTAQSVAINRLEMQIDSIINDAIRQKAFPGCVVYAAQQDSTIFFKSYGHHTYDSVKSVEKTDIYDLASITKVMGATLALMKLYDDGVIHLDDPIKTYVDGLGRKVGNVTLRQALAHQGGLYPWIPFHQRMRKKNGSFRNKSVSSVRDETYNYPISDSLFLHRDFYRKIKKMIRKSDVADDPSYRYSGLFFYLVPEMVQTFTGMDLDTYLKTQFFDPLEAPTLTYNPLDRFELNHIIPTEIDTFFRMSPIHGKVHDEGAIMMGGVSGNAGLFGNAEDVAKVWQLLLNDGQYDSLHLLSPQSIALFTTAHYPNLDNRRGLGFDKPLLVYDSIRSSVAKDASFKSYGHTGYTGTLAWADPEHDLLFIFLSNRVYPDRTHGALYRLNVRPTIHQLLYDYLKDEKNKIEPPVGSTK